MRRRSKLRLSRVQAGLPCQPSRATRATPTTAVSTSALLATAATTVGTTLAAAIGTALAARATPATGVNERGYTSSVTSSVSRRGARIESCSSRRSPESAGGSMG